MMPRPSVWTDDKRRQLREMWGKDMAAPVIAAKLGIKVSTLQSEARRLGLPRKGRAGRYASRPGQRWQPAKDPAIERAERLALCPFVMEGGVKVYKCPMGGRHDAAQSQ